MQKPSVDIVAVVISSPLLIGIYENEELVKTIKKEGKTSDILPEIFDSLLKDYEINSIVYSKGPGSFMAIKIAYVFFKTLEIAKNISFFGADGFWFVKNGGIKAVGNSCFVKKEGIISLEKNIKAGEFELPKRLNDEMKDKNTAPLYILKAV